MRHPQPAVWLSVAVDAAVVNQPALGVEGVHGLVKQLPGSGMAKALDGLEPPHAPNGGPHQAAIAAAAAPAWVMGLDDMNTHTMVASQVPGTAQARVAGANNGDIRIDGSVNRAIHSRGLPCCSHPVGSRIFLPAIGR